jgi:hypothetical protein
MYPFVSMTRVTRLCLKAIMAFGTAVLDHLIVSVFALCERKKQKRKLKYLAAAGKLAPNRSSTLDRQRDMATN